MPYLVGLAGPTCSGKTSICSAIASQTGYEYIPQDSFFVDREFYPLYKGFVNMDSLESIKSELLLDALRSLREGRPVEIPIYDKVASRAVGKRVAYPTDIVLAEGFLLFCDPRIRDVLDLKVYLDLGEAVQKDRRIKRGVHGDAKYFDEVVVPMFNIHGIGICDAADVILDADKPLDILLEEVKKLIMQRGTIRC